MTDDTLRGYTLTGPVREKEPNAIVVCDRCHVAIVENWNVALLDVVQAAVEHSGRCLE